MFNFSQLLTKSLDEYYVIDRRIQDKEITGSNEEERVQILAVLENVMGKINEENKIVETLEVKTKAAHSLYF